MLSHSNELVLNPFEEKIIVPHTTSEKIPLQWVRVDLLVVLSSSVMSDSLRAHGLGPARLLCPWGFSRQEYWSGLPCPPPGDLPNPGMEPRSPTSQSDSLLSEPWGKPDLLFRMWQILDSNLRLPVYKNLTLNPPCASPWGGSPQNCVDRHAERKGAEAGA